MNSAFWIIMIIVDILFLLFALARIGSNYQSEEDRLKTELAIANLTTTFVSPLIIIASLISTITFLISMSE